jgi:predicted acyltransferase
MAAAALATCIWLVDVLGLRRWTPPFVVFGVNPLVAFVGSGMMARLIYSVIRVPYRGETVPVQRVTYEALFASWLAPRNASLLFAVTFVLLWAALLWILHRQRVYLRV